MCPPHSVIINPISTGTSKPLADAAVIMSDIFRKRKLAEKAIKERHDSYFGMDGWKNNKSCFKRTMEERAYSYCGADMLCRFYRREFPFQYSLVKEFLEIKILRDGFSPLSNRFYNREFPYQYSVEKEFLEKETLRNCYFTPVANGESSNSIHDIDIGAGDAVHLVNSGVAPGAAIHDMVFVTDDAASPLGGLRCGLWCRNS